MSVNQLKQLTVRDASLNLCVYNPSGNAMNGTFRIFVEICQTEVV